MQFLHKCEETGLDNPVMHRGLPGRTDLDGDPHFSTIFAFLASQGGGHITLANGRGIRLNVSIFEASEEGVQRPAEIYFLCRTTQGQYTAFALAGLSDYVETSVVETFGPLVDLWLRKREVSGSQFRALCVQILSETDEMWFADKGVTQLRSAP